MTPHLSLRGWKICITMLWEDLTLLCDANGTEFLEFKEHKTKTRHGGTRNTRAFSPRIYSGGKFFISYFVYLLLYMNL